MRPLLTVPTNEWLGGSNKNLISNGACGVPGRPPQYEALTALTGAMAQRTFCFSETIGRPYSVSMLRLNKGGIMDMMTFRGVRDKNTRKKNQKKKKTNLPIWIRYMRYTQNTSVPIWIRFMRSPLAFIKSLPTNLVSTLLFNFMLELGFAVS